MIGKDLQSPIIGKYQLASLALNSVGSPVVLKERTVPTLM